MKRRKYIGTLFGVIVSCMIMGCNGNASKDNALSKSDIPSHISEEYDKYFTVDAEVKVEQPDRIFQYSATLYAPEPDKLQEVFMPKEQVETESIPEQWRYSCRSADKKRYASTAIGIRYQDSDFVDYYVLLSSGDVSHFFPEDFRAITTVRTVSVAEPDEVKKEVKEIAEKLDINLHGEPYVCVGLESEGLEQLYQREAETYIQNGIELPQYLKDIQVSEDMECYYLLWQVECPNGELLRNANYSSDGVISNGGAFVAAIYTPGGVTTFFDNFTFVCDGEEEVAQIISVEDALQQVKKLYDNVILSEENQVELTQISLEEVSVLTDIDKATYEIKPAWCFYGTTGQNEDDFMRLIDAQTGEIIK